MPGRLRVLIIDDHPGVVRAVSRVLAFEHDVVGSAGTGHEVLPAAKLLKPDVVVLDLNIPDVDGVTVCRDLNQRQAGIAVVIFTAGFDEDTHQRAMDAGAAAFVGKNEGADALLVTLRRIAAERSAVAAGGRQLRR